jgi:prevent-host-death family protein
MCLLPPDDDDGIVVEDGASEKIVPIRVESAASGFVSWNQLERWFWAADELRRAARATSRVLERLGVRAYWTASNMSYNMSYMGKPSVSIRELQQDLKRVMARVERGAVVEVTRRNRPVALLAPCVGGAWV